MREAGAGGDPPLPHLSPSFFHSLSLLCARVVLWYRIPRTLTTAPPKRHFMEQEGCTYTGGVPKVSHWRRTPSAERESRGSSKLVLNVSCFLPLSRIYSVFLSNTLSHTHALSHTLSRTHSRSHTLSHTLSLSNTHTLSLSRGRRRATGGTRPHLCLSFSLSLTHTIACSRSLSLSLSFSFSLAHT